MRTKNLFVTTAFILMLSATVSAQEDATVKEIDMIVTKTDTAIKKSAATWHAMNYFKINLAAIPIKSFSFQYERILNKRFSVALGVGTIPTSALPFKSNLLKLVDDNPEMQNQIMNMTFGNISVTPEIRIYVSKKGYGSGFYFAPFYRYAVYKGSGLQYTYDENEFGEPYNLSMSGELTGNTIGLLMGVQKSLGKHISLDLWLIGPHYGKAKGEFAGVASTKLTLEQQENLRQDLEDLEIPLVNKTITVDENGANVKIDGPFAGYRFGIAIGFKF